MFNQKDYLKQWKLNNPNKIKAYEERRKAKYKLDAAERTKKAEYYKQHQEHKRAYAIAWRKLNASYMSNYMKTRRKKYPGKVKLEESNKQQKLKRQYKLTNNFLKELKVIYDNCPDGYEVDHIIPLTHEQVSGLNVPWNLQYLTRQENGFKRAKWDGTWSNNSWRSDNA